MNWSLPNMQNYMIQLKHGFFGQDMVILHNQDDFFPPICTYVDIRPFIKGLKRTYPNTEIRIMQINETMTI